MPSFSDNPAKRTVREEWNTPLLRFLSSEHGFRYRYMGLPGVDLLDLQLWRDLIEEVVAFEVPAKLTAKDRTGRRNINKLRSNLRALRFNARSYYGPMEEVVILRHDHDGLPYSQSSLITLYNLDFCDEISSAVETLQAGKQVWRFEAIRQILTDQKACYDPEQGPAYFVILLTVRDQIDVAKLRAQFSAPFADSKYYWDSCEVTHPLPPEGFILGDYTWSLKTFIHDQMRKWFVTPNVSALFFPVVKYVGTPVQTAPRTTMTSPMLHMMIMCRFADRTVSNPLSLPHKFLDSVSCVRANDDGTLSWDPEPGEPEHEIGSPDPQAWFLQHCSSLMT